MKNDIGRHEEDGCIDTAIVRVYDDNGDMIEIEVLPKSDRLSICICPSEATLKRLKREAGGETIVLTKEQEQLIFGKLAARAKSNKSSAASAISRTDYDDGASGKP